MPSLEQLDMMHDVLLEAMQDHHDGMIELESALMPVLSEFAGSRANNLLACLKVVTATLSDDIANMRLAHAKVVAMRERIAERETELGNRTDA